MLFHFLGSLGKTPDLMADTEVFSYAHGFGFSGKNPSYVTRGALLLSSAGSPTGPNCRKFASAAPIHPDMRGPMLDYGDGNTHYREYTAGNYRHPEIPASRPEYPN